MFIVADRANDVPNVVADAVTDVAGGRRIRTCYRDPHANINIQI
jgi:hypothetical protein